MQHLSYPTTHKLLAWHTKHDLCATRSPANTEHLWVEGQEVRLDLTKHFHPTQQVINACHSRAPWAKLAVAICSQGA